MSDILITIAIWAIPVLLAITLHEAAHGWMADRLGDSTARQLGRITINPLKHIDPFGTILVPLLMIMTFGIAIGAAKPVPVNPNNFKKPLLDMAVVALAGPGSNFLMACGWAGLIAFSIHMIPEMEIAQVLYRVGQAGVAINIILLAVNMLPVPPLDGSKVVAGIMPTTLAIQFMRFERYGFFLLIGLVFAEVLLHIPVFSTILLLLVKPFMGIIETLFNFQGIYF